jgi:hypothetical protein
MGTELGIRPTSTPTKWISPSPTWPKCSPRDVPWGSERHRRARCLDPETREWGAYEAFALDVAASKIDQVPWMVPRGAQLMNARVCRRPAACSDSAGRTTNARWCSSLGKLPVSSARSSARWARRRCKRPSRAATARQRPDRQLGRDPERRVGYRLARDPPPLL